MRKHFLVAAFAALLAGMGGAAAQTYPSRPITLVVAFAAGGSGDTIARILADHMRIDLGQTVVVENVGGAAGSLGVGRAARAAPDGHTLIIGTSTTNVLIGALYTLSFDLLKDLEPIALLASEPLLIVTKKNLPVADLKQLIAWLKANPGKASAGIAGVGATGHVTGLAFQQATGTRFQFIPYRGNAPAMQDLIAGQIDLMIEPSSNFLAQVRNGNLKACAITAKTRLSAAPDIPTVDEAGLPGFYASLWYGLWVPKDTPKAIIAKLNAAIVDALASPQVRTRLAELGPEIPPRDQQTPEVLGAFQKAEAEKWWPIIKAANIKAE